MPSKKTLMGAILIAVCGFPTIPSSAFAASTGLVLHSSAQGRDGDQPEAGLIFDAAGNLYGTTEGGGAYKHYGTVFQLTPGAHGTWTEKVLHSFDKGMNGNRPEASLILDSAGNLYGTTVGGGYGTCDPVGCGTVFELSPGTNGKWTEKTLHRFKNNGHDGYNPYASLIFDSAGNLYGTTLSGGPDACSAGLGCGTVFELSPSTNGKWTERILHSFKNNGHDGYNPYASLISDTAGNLYGTTTGGGDHLNNCGGCGTVFRLTPHANGDWTETVLYSFTGGNDGESPAGLIFDAGGSLYGTADGIVYQLTPGADSSWTETTLYDLAAFSYPSLIFDAVGNLYGTTVRSGTNHKGAVFQLTPGANGRWTENVLYTFCADQPCTDGAWPYAGVIFDSSGNLFGTTLGGGAHSSGCSGAGCGTAFQLVPGANGDWTESVLHSFGKL